jgi:hypothetical protein
MAAAGDRANLSRRLAENVLDSVLKSPQGPSSHHCGRSRLMRYLRPNAEFLLMDISEAMIAHSLGEGVERLCERPLRRQLHRG